jgi:predicted DNA-binding antitoxin AbrB/MazE fold protein
MGIIRVKAVYENKILKPLEKLELEEGEEVEIELKRREEKRGKKAGYFEICGDLEGLERGGRKDISRSSKSKKEKYGRGIRKREEKVGEGEEAQHSRNMSNLSIVLLVVSLIYV